MLAGLILIAMLLLDCAAVHLISKDELSETRQKVMQVVLVIFVPLIGSLLVIFVNRSKPSSNGKYDENTNFESYDGTLNIRNKNELELDGNDD